MPKVACPPVSQELKPFSKLRFCTGCVAQAGQFGADEVADDGSIVVNEVVVEVVEVLVGANIRLPALLPGAVEVLVSRG